MNISKKIFVVTNDAEMLLNFRGHIIDRFLVEGYNVTIAAPNITSETKFAEGVSLESISFKGRDTSLIGAFYEMYNIIRLIRKVKPDYVMPFQMKVFVLTCIATLFTPKFKLNFILSGLGNGWSVSFASRVVLNLLFKPCIKLCNRVFVLNTRDYSVIKSLGYNSTKIIMLPGEGVDLCKFSYSEPKVRNSLHFYYIGRTIYPKGIGVFIDAAIEYLQSYKGSAKFFIVGDSSVDDPEHFPVQNYLKDKSNQIKYLGKRNDVHELIIDSNFVVIPSFMNEGLPRVALEAFSVGRPIICTDVPGLSDVADYNYDSFKINCNSVSSLVKAFRQATSMSAEQIREMGMKGHQKIRNYYTNSHVQDIIMMHFQNE